MRKDRWNTFAVTGYSHDVANDHRSAGGVHLHQVKRGPAGWMRRIKQANGRFSSFGAVEPISDQEGEAKYEQAKTQ